MAELKGMSGFCASFADVWSGKSGNKEESYEEMRKRFKPPIECNTAENSEQLHEMYKDTVKYTEPDPEKMKAMKEFLSHLVHADDVHNSNVLIAKKSATGVKRRPSILGHLVHDDSDDETEKEGTEKTV